MTTVAHLRTRGATVLLAFTMVAACADDAGLADSDIDPTQLAHDVCAAVLECVSSIPTVDECADIQLDCRSQLDDPGEWDDHMLGCLDIDRVADDGCRAYMECIQQAPRPASCQGGRP